jgi:hypothetical protein
MRGAETDGDGVPCCFVSSCTPDGALYQYVERRAAESTTITVAMPPAAAGWLPPSLNVHFYDDQFASALGDLS